MGQDMTFPAGFEIDSEISFFLNDNCQPMAKVY